MIRSVTFPNWLTSKLEETHYCMIDPTEVVLPETGCNDVRTGDMQDYPDF